MTTMTTTTRTMKAEDKEEKIALVQDRVRPEIYQSLLGTQPGDVRTITLHYGEDEENEQLRGRDVTYTITVRNVQERLLPDWEELPTLTDFEGDIDALRANARNRLEHAAEERARKKVVDTFLDRLVEETQLEIPDAMIEERSARIVPRTGRAVCPVRHQRGTVSHHHRQVA